MSLTPSASQFVLDALLHVFKTSRDYRDGLTRICMRGIFTLLGADDVRVKEYRQRNS